jgi:hypothetical protein
MVLVLVFFAVLAISYANGTWLLHRIRAAHPDIWAKLGEPSLSQSNLGKSRLALARFVWTMQFRSLNDTGLSTRCFIAIGLEILMALMFIGTVLIEKSHGA